MTTTHPVAREKNVPTVLAPLAPCAPESKSTLETKVLAIYLGTVIAIAVGASVVGAPKRSGVNTSGAHQAPDLVSIKASGRMVIRGQVKSGSCGVTS